MFASSLESALESIQSTLTIVKAVWVHWTYCQVQETSWRSLELRDVARYLVWIVVSCSSAMGAVPSVVFCCRTPLVRGLHYYTFTDALLYTLVMTSCFWVTVDILSTESSRLTSDINKVFSPNFFGAFSVSPRDGCVSEIARLVHLVPTAMPQSKLHK